MKANVAVKVSSSLQDIAGTIDRMLAEAAGERVGFQLLVWAGGEVSYVGTETNHERAIKAFEELIAKWKANTVETPAHLRN